MTTVTTTRGTAPDRPQLDKEGNVISMQGYPA
jgi:hypothetical protein